MGLIANGNQLHYIEPDHLGTPRVVIEVARNVPVWSWDLKSEAFGNSVPHQNPDGDTNSLIFDMRFPGQRYDAVSVLCTYRCTAACKQCCFESSPTVEGCLSRQVILDRISEANREFTTLRLVVFSRGEATLLKDDLYAAIAHATSLGLFTRIVSNGSGARQSRRQSAWPGP